VGVGALLSEARPGVREAGAEPVARGLAVASRLVVAAMRGLGVGPREAVLRAEALAVAVAVAVALEVAVEVAEALAVEVRVEVEVVEGVGVLVAEGVGLLDTCRKAQGMEAAFQFEPLRGRGLFQYGLVLSCTRSPARVLT
jgi:hypothetical protein